MQSARLSQRWFHRLPPILLPMASALLLHAGFAVPSAGLCSWFAFLPLFWSITRTNTLPAFIQGMITGFIFSAINLCWITNAIRNFTSLPLVATLLIMALLAAYLSLYYGLFALLVARHPPGSWIGTLFLAASWTLLEWLRGTILYGFPWNLLGYTVGEHSFYLNILPYGGIYSLSFLVIYGNLALFVLFNRRHQAMDFLRQAALLLTVPALFALFAAMGLSPVAQLNRQTIQVTIVQPNIPQAEKWAPAFREQNFAVLEQLSRQAALQTSPDSPHLIIWPEAAIPDFLQDAPDFQTAIALLLASTNSYLLAGSPRHLGCEDSPPYRYYNSAMFFTPEGTIASLYDKIKLVPYGEFTPLAELLPFLGKMVPGADFSPGNQVITPFLNGTPFVPSICFEGIFPEFIAGAMADGAGFLVNITNDAWFGLSAGPRQHLANTRMRAIEHRCYLLRCANTGISAIIDPTGRIIDQLPLNCRGVLQAAITPMTTPTFYARHPYGFIVCLAVMAAITGICLETSKNDGFS